MRLGFAEQIDFSRFVEVKHTFIHFERCAINHHGIAQVRNSTAVDVVAPRKRKVTTGIDRDFHNQTL